MEREELMYAEVTSRHPVEAEAQRVLVVDDDPRIRQVMQRILTSAGYEVMLAGDGSEACEGLDRHPPDLVLTDIGMPKLSGVDLLRKVRSRDAELPVILFTGNPTTDDAIDAINLHATCYLKKPIEPATLLSEVRRALTMRDLARVRRAAMEHVTGHGDTSHESDSLLRNFNEALSSLHMVYQPIVSHTRRKVFGYEALVRCKHPAMPHPGVLFDAAEELGRIHDLGRRIRRIIPEPVGRLAEDVSLFVNLHPLDLLDDDLYDPNGPLTQIACRVVLEVTERGKLTEIADLVSRIDRLREFGFRIAIDDIGAGYSGLNSFAMLHPDLVKMDIELIRDVDRDPIKQRLTRMLIDLCRDLGIAVVAEGVETAAERDTLLALGCEIFQGYFFARPQPPFVEPKWE